MRGTVIIRDITRVKYISTIFSSYREEDFKVSVKIICYDAIVVAIIKINKVPCIYVTLECNNN